MNNQGNFQQMFNQSNVQPMVGMLPQNYGGTGINSPTLSTMSSPAMPLLKGPFNRPSPMSMSFPQPEQHAGGDQASMSASVVTEKKSLEKTFPQDTIL